MTDVPSVPKIVLIIDDDANAIRRLRRCLRRRGHTVHVHHVLSPGAMRTTQRIVAAALRRLLRPPRPDVVILDLLWHGRDQPSLRFLRLALAGGHLAGVQLYFWSRYLDPPHLPIRRNFLALLSHASKLGHQVGAIRRARKPRVPRI